MRKSSLLNRHLLSVEVYLRLAAFFEFAEEDFAHQEGRERGVEDAVDFTCAVLGREAFFQQLLEGRVGEREGYVLVFQAVGKFAEFLFEDE